MPFPWLAAAGLASGALGFLGSRSRDKSAQGQFDAQQDQSIQRRVEDAKKAGVHPLFALGASVGTSPTIYAGETPGGALGKGLETAAQGIESSQRTKASADQTVVANARADTLATAQERALLAQANRDEAQANLTNSQRARITQNMGATGHDTLGVGPGTFGEGLGVHEVIPGQSTATQPAPNQERVAGHSEPFFKRYNVWGKHGVYGPSAQEPAEAFENVGGLALALVYNTAVGTKVMVDYAHKYLKAAAKQDYARMKKFARLLQNSRRMQQPKGR